MFGSEAGEILGPAISMNFSLYLNSVTFDNTFGTYGVRLGSKDLCRYIKRYNYAKTHFKDSNTPRGVIYTNRYYCCFNKKSYFTHFIVLLGTYFNLSKIIH